MDSQTNSLTTDAFADAREILPMDSKTNSPHIPERTGYRLIEILPGDSQSDTQ